MVAVSSTSDLSNNCEIPGCTSLGIILVGRNREAAGDSCLMCTMHYYKLLDRMKEQGIDEDDTDVIGAEEILGMMSGNEFQRIVKKIVEDEKFKQLVKRAAKRGTPKQGKLF